jgi:hypothetical protein
MAGDVCRLDGQWRAVGGAPGLVDWSHLASSTCHRRHGRVHAGIAQRLAVTPEDHVWFEDRWMVASLCDE